MALLFTPLKMGAQTLPNRICVPPMCCCLAREGVGSDELIAHYEKLAASGAGLVVIEATAVRADGRITTRCLGLYNDEQERFFKRLLKACRAVAPAETKFFLQLSHCGRKGSRKDPKTGSSIISMVQTFGTLVTAARTAAVAMAGAFGPVGLVLTAVAAIAGVVLANWDSIWPALKAGASAAADFIGAVWDTVVPKFQAVFGSLLSIAKAFFQGDISGLLSGFDDLFQAAFNLLPDKWAKACLDWYTGVTESLRNVGRMISDYFTNFDFKSLLPEVLHKAGIVAIRHEVAPMIVNFSTRSTRSNCRAP